MTVIHSELYLGDCFDRFAHGGGGGGGGGGWVPHSLRSSRGSSRGHYPEGEEDQRGSICVLMVSLSNTMGVFGSESSRE